MHYLRKFIAFSGDFISFTVLFEKDFITFITILFEEDVITLVYVNPRIFFFLLSFHMEENRKKYLIILLKVLSSVCHIYY